MSSSAKSLQSVQRETYAPSWTSTPWRVPTSRWRYLRLAAILAAGLLFFRVLFAILIEYRWYFPPDFDRSAFLGGRRYTFTGIYPLAFYIHILSGPVALLLGLLLVVTGGKARFRPLHRRGGKLQLWLVLTLIVPSGLVMASRAYAGPVAAWGFFLLAVSTGFCVVMAAYHAIRRRFQVHQRWATRCFVLLVSPLILRVVNGLVIVMQWESDLSYQLNAWLSWLVPLVVYEAWCISRSVSEARNRSSRQPLLTGDNAS